MIQQEQRAIFELQLFLPYENKGNEKHRTETISLPATKERLEQARKAMGAKRLERCRIMNRKSAKRELMDYLPLSYDLNGLNAFAKVLAEQGVLSSEEKTNKLLAALEAELVEDMKSASEIAAHLERYEILPDHLQSPKEYALYIWEKEKLQIAGEMKAFVDFEAFGKHRMRKDGVVRTSHGVIARRDQPMKQLPEELTEIRLFSPLKAEFYFMDEWGNTSEDREEVTPKELCQYEEQITGKITQERLDTEGDRGLAVYLDNRLLGRKVYSMTPAVEIWQGELWGVLEVKSYGPLSQNMLDAVIEEWRGQESDGWGEGLEQRPIQTGDGELYVSFWNSSDRFFITTEERLKGSHTQGLSMISRNEVPFRQECVEPKRRMTMQ